MSFAAVLAALAFTFLGHAVDVRCATVQEWPDTIAQQLGPNTRAYTWFNHGVPEYTVYGPQSCGYMVLLVADPNDRQGSRLNGIDTRPREAYSALTFLHELEYYRVGRDEGRAECDALHALPAFLKQLHVRAAGSLLAYAAAYHAAKPPVYRSVC